MKKSKKKNTILEMRIYAIALAIAVFLIALPVFLRAHGDDTPIHSTATPVGTNETHGAQPAVTPKTAASAASEDVGDLPFVSPRNWAANLTPIAKPVGAAKPASDDATPAVSGSFFTAGNIVVAVAGCGVHAGTCATPPVGGTGTGGTYGDDQAAPWTLFQYTPNGATSATFVNSLQLPVIASGANFPVSDDFGSQSEGTVQLSGNGEYLTMMGYGINAADFNVNYLLYCPGSTNASNACVPENGNPATAQTGTLTAPVAGVSGTTAVPRVAMLIDPNGNVNTSTVLYNIFDENDARSSYSPDGVNIYVSGQGCKTCGPTPNQIPLTSANPPFDNTMGVYYTPIGVTNTAPTPITGNDNGPTGCSTTTTCTASEDTRMVQIFNNTLYVSADAKPGSSTGGYNRSVIGTLGNPPATSLFTCTGVGEGCGTGYGPFGPALLTGLDNTGGTGKVTISAGNNGNGLNVETVTCSVNTTTTLTCPSGTFSSADVGDTLAGTDIPSGTTISTFTNSSAVVMSNAGTGTVASDTVSIGLLINMSPQNFFFASPTVLYVADTGSPKNSSNNDTICATDGGGSKSVGAGGLQKWINISTTFTATLNGAKTVTAPSGTFSYLDVGLPISGTGIPAGTTITSVSSSTTAKVSNTETASGSESLTIGPAWSLAYTLYQGLNLVLNVDCDAANDNTTGTGATGLYGLTGVVNSGVATLYVTNYPNDDLIQTFLYGITDTLTTTAYPGTSFNVLDTAPTGSLFRGVSFVPTIPNGTVDITSAPSGLTVSTAGAGCSTATVTTPRMAAWTPSSSCTLSVTSPQNVGGVQYAFSQWQDGTTGTSDVVTTPTTTATYTATFTTQYQLTTSAGSGGSVSAGGFYAPNANATVTATPSANFCFANFTSAAQLGYPPVSPSTPSTANPFTFAMTGPESITANFQPAITPAPGSTFSGTSATFSWCANANATAYWLDVGTSTQANLYYSSGSLPTSTTSETVSSLPSNGSMVYVTVYYLINGTWSPNTYTYTAFGGNAGAATMASPAPNSTLTSNSVTFTWNAATDTPTAYWLDIGTSTQANSYFSSGSLSTSTLSETVTSIPTNGSTVYVTLYTQTGGVWVNNVYTYQTFSVSAGQAVLTSPTPNNNAPPMLPDSTVTFTWSTGTGAFAYYLDIGTTSQANDYYSQNQGTGNSVTVYGLPTNGSTVVVTVYTQFSSGGPWYSNAYNFTALNLPTDQAALTSPTPNNGAPPVLPGSSVTFTWSTGTGAFAYYLDVGNNSAVNAYYSQNQATGTSVTVNGLPTDGSQVVVTLYTQFSNGGTWYSTTYLFTAQ